MCSDCHLRLDHSSSTELLGLRDHARSDGSQYRRSRTLVFRASDGARGSVKERTNGHVGVLFLLSGCHGTSGFRILHWLLEVALRRDFHPGRFLLRHHSPLRLRVSSLVSDPRTLGRGDAVLRNFATLNGKSVPSWVSLLITSRQWHSLLQQL